MGKVFINGAILNVDDWDTSMVQVSGIKLQARLNCEALRLYASFHICLARFKINS